MSHPTLLQSQTNALRTLLNLNQPPTTSSTSNSSGQTPRPGTPSTAFDDNAQSQLVWKVLILDEQSQAIFAPSFRIPDFREQGVTLHM